VTRNTNDSLIPKFRSCNLDRSVDCHVIRSLAHQIYLQPDIAFAYITYQKMSPNI